LTIVRKLAHFSLEIFLKLDQFFSNALCFELKRIYPHTDAHTRNRSPFFIFPIDGCKVVSILNRTTEIVTTVGVWPSAIRQLLKKHLTGYLLVQGKRMASFLTATSILLRREKRFTRRYREKRI